jgi:hypothetical protein
MTLFECPACGAGLFFDNAACGACGAEVGFDPASLSMAAVARGAARGPGPRRCHDADLAGCNWLLAPEDDRPLCLACRLNRTIPDLSIEGHAALWRAIEAEKRRLVYGLLRLGLPIEVRADDPRGMAFDFLADPDPSFSDRGKVITGHADGLITLNIREADPAERERMRQAMDEPYRSLLGHLRHEAAHHYWERIVRDTALLGPFRAAFGDERADYGAALERHYAEGPPADWRERHVSAYASSHPWEDWAESFAHYLHMVDTLETAWRHGLTLAPRTGAATRDALAAAPDFDPCEDRPLDELMDRWLPLTVTLNELSRSMGQAPLYPFALSTPAIGKIAFVHRAVHAPRTRGG